MQKFPTPALLRKVLTSHPLTKFLIPLFVLLTIAIVAYFYFGDKPIQMLVSNITNQGATITFFTRNKQRGTILYYPVTTKGQHPQIKEEIASRIHQFELKNLEAKQEYEYVVSVGLQKEKGSFRTAPLTENISSPRPIFGQVYQKDGKAPASEVLVILQLESVKEGKSSLLTTVTNGNGMYSFDLGNLKKMDLSEFIRYQNGDRELIKVYGVGGVEGTLEGKVGLDQPLPPLTLKKEGGKGWAGEIYAQEQGIPTEPPTPTPTISPCLYQSWDECTAAGECSESDCTGSGNCWYCESTPTPQPPTSTPTPTSTCPPLCPGTVIPTPTPISIQCETEGGNCREVCQSDENQDGVKGCDFYDAFGGSNICCKLQTTPTSTCPPLCPGTVVPTATPTVGLGITPITVTATPPATATPTPTPIPDPNAYFNINLDGIVTGVYQGTPFGVDDAMVVAQGEVTLTSSTGYFQFSNLQIPDPDNNGEETIGVLVNKQGFEETPVTKEILVRPNRMNRVTFILTPIITPSPTPIPTPDPNASLCVQSNESCNQYELCAVDLPNQYYCTAATRCCWAKEFIVRLNGRLIDDQGQVVDEEAGYDGPVKYFEIHGTLWNGQEFRQWRVQAADRDAHDGPLTPWSIETDWGDLPDWQDARVRPGESFRFADFEIEVRTQNAEGRNAPYPRSGANYFSGSYVWNAPPNESSFWNHDRIVDLNLDFYITSEGATPIPTFTPTPTLSPTPTIPVTPTSTPTATPTPGPPITLTGHVIDQKGNPVADVDISVCDPHSERGEYACQYGDRYVIAKTETQDNPLGHFSIDIPQSGYLIIRIASSMYPKYAPQRGGMTRYDYFTDTYVESNFDLTLQIGINFVLPYSEEEYQTFKNFGFNGYPVNTSDQAWTLEEVQGLQGEFNKIPQTLWNSIGSYRMIKDPNIGGGQSGLCAETSPGYPEIRIKPDRIFTCFSAGGHIIWVHELVHQWHHKHYGNGFIEGFHKKMGLNSSNMNDWLPQCAEGEFRRGDDCCSTPQGEWCQEKACWRGHENNHGLQDVGECLAVSGADWYLSDGGSFANYFPEAYNWVENNIHGGASLAAVTGELEDGPRDVINTENIVLRIKVIDHETGAIIPDALISYLGRNSLSEHGVSVNWTENGFAESMARRAGEVSLTVSAEGYKKFSDTVDLPDKTEQTLAVGLVKGSAHEEGGSYQLINHENLYLHPGWNLVSTPVQLSSNSSSISTLKMSDLTAMNQVPGLMASQWADGHWQPYVYGLAGTDFSLTTSQAIMIKSDQPQILAIEGETVAQTAPISLSAGTNLVSIPYPVGKYTAESLIDAINSVVPEVAISVTSFESGLYQTFTKINEQTFGQNFPIFPKAGYFINATKEVTFTP